MTTKKSIDLKRIFAWSVVGMVAIDVAFDTGPMVCAVDPTCRKMTKDEIAMARPIFGETIPYDQVRIFKRPPWQQAFNSDMIATTLYKNIYLTAEMGEHQDDYGYALRPLSSMYMPPRPDNAGIFIHELTHVWQNKTTGRSYNVDEMDYGYELKPEKTFESYNREQQAEIVHSYFEKRRIITDIVYKIRHAVSSQQKTETQSRLGAECQALHAYITVLAPTLPLEPVMACSNQTAPPTPHP